MESADVNEQMLAVTLVGSVAEKEKESLRVAISKKIKKGLESSDNDVQRASIAMIPFAPKDEAFSLIELGLESSNPEVQKSAVDMVWTVSKQQSRGLFDIIREKGLGDEFVKPPLYQGESVNSQNFSRKEFEKTGSSTTLLGGDLKGKTIVRSIEPKAFLAWQKLFESHELWKNNGFDYVPLEPIQSYRLNKDGLVDVFSGVLDLSLGDWQRKTNNMFEAELSDQKAAILNVLGITGVEHGHAHNDNFCLRFFRDENGKVNFNRAPRLYLIDFDQAVSP